MDSAGSVYACDRGRNQVLKIDPTGHVSIYSTGTDKHQLVNPNYCAFDNDSKFSSTNESDSATGVVKRLHNSLG